MVRQSVLVVEDEEDIRELVSYNLLKEGYQVAGVASGEDALTAVESKTPDLILLDIMLPGLDGLRVCRKLKENPRFAVDPHHHAHGQGRRARHRGGAEHGGRRLRHQAVQSQGAARPNAGRVASCRGRARRFAEEEEESEIVEIRDLMIHPGRHEVFVCGKPVELTATEFKLLHFLAQRPGWVFTRQQILDGVHGDNYAITDRAVDVQIVGLRRKLGAAGSYIETVRGVGYRFKE